MSSVLTFEDAVDLPLDPLSTLTMLYTEDGFEELKGYQTTWSASANCAEEW